MSATAPNPLCAAAARGDAAAVAALLARGTDANAKEPARKGLTALMIAAGYGHSDCVHELLRGGADPNCADGTAGAFAIHKACQGGHVEIVRLLVEHGALLDCQVASTGHTPLIEAVWFGAVAVVEFLLDAGALLDVPTHYGFTLQDHLDYQLAVNGASEAQQRLHTIAAAVERRRARDRATIAADAVLRAVADDDLAALDAALAAGSATEERAPRLGTFDDGHTPLLLAARDGRVAAARRLLAAGAGVNAVEPTFLAVPLHKTTYHGDAALTEVLARQPGADLDYQGPTNGYTPLHDALWHGHGDCARILVEAGARLDLRGHDGKTPLDLAMAQLGPDDPVTELIRAKQAEGRGR